MELSPILDGFLDDYGITREDLGSAGLIMFGILGWFGVFSDSKAVRFSTFVNLYCATAGGLLAASVWDDTLVTAKGVPSMGASAVFETVPYGIQLILGLTKSNTKDRES